MYVGLSSGSAVKADETGKNKKDRANRVVVRPKLLAHARQELGNV